MKKSSEFGQRVYEYEGPDGAVFYSFHKYDDTISTPIRLRLRSRLGTHLINFLVKLRRLGDALRRGTSDDDW